MARESDVLTSRAAVGYGVGDFAMNLYWGALSYFLLYWYTDVVGLPPAVAGFVFFAGTFWDAITDPTVGYLVGRNRSRWGRYRPFLLFGAVPLAASFALLFWVPPLREAALTAALLAAHLVFRTAYTIVGIPYSALSARISRRSYDRTTLASARMIAATAGTLLISSAGFPLVKYFGQGDEQRGFFFLAIVAGAVAILFHFICFAATAEPPESEFDRQGSGRPYRLGDILTILRTNTAFLYLLGITPLIAGAAALLQKCLVYYVKYGLQTHGSQHVVLFVHGLTVMLATPLWAYVAHRWHRRSAWLWATGVMLVSASLMFIATPDSFAAFLIMLFPISASFAALGILFWSMLPDTIEYGQWRSGFRAESVFFGVATFTQKMAIGIAGWMLGGLLSVVGFVPAAEQPPVAVTAMKAGMTLAPAALMFLALLIVLRYPLDAKLHQRIRQELGGEDETGR